MYSSGFFFTPFEQEQSENLIVKNNRWYFYSGNINLQQEMSKKGDCTMKIYLVYNEINQKSEPNYLLIRLILLGIHNTKCAKVVISDEISTHQI